jgi:transposase
MQRKVYSKEFKFQVLREGREAGNIAEAARKHGIQPELVYKWGRLYPEGSDTLVRPATGPDRAGELLTQMETLFGQLKLIDPIAVQRIESAVKDLQVELRKEFIEIKKMLHHMNRRLGDIDLTLHSKSEVTAVEETA